MTNRIKFYNGFKKRKYIGDGSFVLLHIGYYKLINESCEDGELDFDMRGFNITLLNFGISYELK